MATKPVRVVSSMGEQSVGKSYCLNHFADTSFAGSAMRTTEGVWLSCTPTEDYLLVSLDFEGVHSIERSAQEDALLVLFNTAISNLVLFRNNFAMSRDIAGLFTSFQSSATVLDPNVNRGLFNSTLAIIIKDVTNADSKDIVREFSLKFQGIVEKERDQNFITRLHRGRIQIIPWPVINSPNFYTLFSRLHQRLDQQPFTHGGGGAFLHNLKTLMAKIKTSDWGSMDQNVAAHRAQQLIERLPNALSFGRHEEGPLKNMDADAELETPEFMPSLFVPEFATGNDAESEALAEQSLLPDTMFIEGLQTSIYEALDHRLTLVRNWVNVNIERFPQGNQDIRNLTNKLDAASLGMRNAVRHSGEHSCGTNHQCVLDCEVAEEHSQREPCGLPAGHGGRHMCDVKTHSCGMECHLSGKGGCAQSCIKIMTGIMCALLEHTSVGSPAISEMRGKGTTEWCLVAPGHAPHRGMNHTNAMLVITPALVLSNAPYADSDKDDVDPVYELQGRKFGSGDEGAPMLCNLVCAAQGRHAHIDHCRDPGNCSNTDCEHIAERMHPDPNREKDWISHATFWARSGFKDPYPQEEQNEFSKCDVLCAGPEHEASATAQANPSYCILPIFHAPEAQQPAPPTGHVSIDGHAFDCQNPSRMNQAYHMSLRIYVRWGSTPASRYANQYKLISESNNRYGAVLSALHGFWLSREVVACSTATQARQDAYSVITFASSATTRVQNDFMSTTDQLISHLLPQRSGGTNFHAALKEAQSLIENHWSSDRSPVIIFLSDGECNIGDNAVYDLCHLCVRLGKALAFHSVSFGQDRCSASLRRMADIAHEVYASAPQDVLSAARGNPCAYTNAIDTIQLADTFLGIASSLQKPRASLMNQHGSGGR
ncbi:cytochrome P450 family protein [Rhizoctonia solani]|uniref:Cytochrome P450 family protein n=1 Tax=Rhizoctonia solani TaxID=456999 RepID=A0A8H8T1V9_9AGAM|nr:cytochrome P450 family protein [Rhizoctonia solani]QRW25749.1 cytochrome P450 family protein [Rhizoctonia solani]